MAHQVFTHFSPARHGNNTGHHYNTRSNSRNPVSPLVNPNSTLPPGDPIPASKSRRRSRGGRKHRKHPRQETDAPVRMTPLSLASPSPAQRITSAFCEDPPSRLPSTELPTFQMDANLYAPLHNLSKATPLVGLKKKLSTTSASGDEVMPDLLNESKTAATASPFSNVPVQALPSFNALFNESNPYWDVMGLKNAKPSPFAGFSLSDKEMEENVNAALRANNTAATTKVDPASSSAKSASTEDKIASTSVGKTKPTGYGNTKTTSAAITNEVKTTADKDVDTGVGRFVLTTGGASPKTAADGSNDESPPTKTKSATASATLTPEEMEELMAKVTAAAHHAATAALYEYTTGEQYRLFRAILGWESLARFTMSQLGRVVSAILYPALGCETTARVLNQCFALNAWEGEQLLQGVSRLGHAVSSSSGWHSITVWIDILETLLLHADVQESAAAEFATAADTVLGKPTCVPF